MAPRNSKKTTDRKPRLRGRSRSRGTMTKKKDNPGASLAVASEELIADQDLSDERKQAIKRGKKHVIPLALPIGRIVSFTITFMLVFVIALTIYVWRSMYVTKTVSDFNYSIARLLPLPVANVDGQTVSYESYLFELNFNSHFLETQEQVDFVNDESGRRIYEDLKVQSMQRAMINKLTRAKAAELNIEVIDAEVDQELESLVDALGEGTIEATAQTHYDTDIDGIRRILEDQLFRAKVGIELDTKTRDAADSLVALTRGGSDFAQLARDESDDVATKESGGLIEGLRQDSIDYHPDVRSMAFELQPGAVSDPFVTWLQTGTRRPVYNIIKREAQPATGETVNIRIIQLDITSSNDILDSLLVSLIKEGKASDRLGLTDIQPEAEPVAEPELTE